MIHYIGIIGIIFALAIAAILFFDNGKHYDDKAYRLCFKGIVEGTLEWNAENGCLEKYGVEIKDNR